MLPDLARVRTALRRERSRLLARDLGPSLVLFLIVWIKLSFFNFPPQEVLKNDWNPWYPTQAAQAMLASLGTLLLLLAPSLLLPPTRRFALLAGVDLLATLLVFSNLLHFRFYGDVISVAALGAGWQLVRLRNSLLELAKPSDALLFVDLGVVLGVWLRRRIAGSPAPEAAPRRTRLRIARVSAAAALLLVVAIPVRIVVLDRGDTFKYNFFRFYGVRKIGLLNYHLYEEGRNLSSALLFRRQVTAGDRARVAAFVDRWRDTATTPSPLFGAARGRNVIFVMVESLQAFPIGLRVGGREVTPVLNRLAARSLYFSNFYGQTWEGTTSDGEIVSLQSVHPLPAGSVATTHPTNHYRGVPRVLAEHGYATLAAHAFYGAMWNRREIYPGLGFEQSLFRESYRPGMEIGLGLADAEFFRQTLPRLERLPRPFMAYLLTLSSHHPYELPPGRDAIAVGELRGTLLGDYLNAIHSVDSALGEFLKGLERDGLLDSSVLVIYGDHKADLGDPFDLSTLLTRYAGFPPRSAGFDARYWREENRLPLIIHLPADAAAGERSLSGGQIDIAPTVLDLVGIADPRLVTFGRALTQGRDALVVFRNASFAVADTLCLSPGAGTGRAECRNVRSGEALDPVHFAPRYQEARERLEISDLVLRGDLIPPE